MSSSVATGSVSSSSGVAFSARSSLSIEVTRTLSVRTGFFAFFGVYSRWRISPSTWMCAPFLSVAANSLNLPKTMQRCHSVCETYSPVSLFLYEVLVAMENVVKFWSFLPVRTSASLPRKPIRIALFWYMVVISVSLNFPYPARVTLSEASEWGRLPSAKECFLGVGPEEVCAAFLAAAAGRPDRNHTGLGSDREQIAVWGKRNGRDQIREVAQSGFGITPAKL